jgi:metal-responsive CopG/Arc/MetJ family transcriptional regulator
MFSLRLPAETREAVDKWAAAQEDRPGRSEAIRRLLNQALAVTPKLSKRRKTD